MDYSLRYFACIPAPSVSHYNVLIRGYSMGDTAHKGLEMYRSMRRAGVFPNPISSSFAVKCCAKMGALSGGLQLHARVLVDGHQLDSLLMTTLMDLYSLPGRFDDACKVFDEILVKDTVTWNVLISCYTKNKLFQEALEVFDFMQREGSECAPDDVTCLLALQACGHLGAFDFGWQVHNYVNEKDYGDRINICNALVAMYAQCGCLEKACEVFKEISWKNVVSWTTMISGFAMNGLGRQAIDLFHEMQITGSVPDDQTFTWVLSACSHSGLVGEGIRLFEQMKTQFGVVPNIHHYGCVVDLLGRAGLLDKAYQLIMSMEVKPDSTIWRTLLAACRIHKHPELGKQALDHLTELKAEQAGDYMLLLNTYSSVGNWEKVTELRKFMKVNEIQTTPGCSTIELKGKVHQFLVDDVAHPRKDEIYEMLDEIGKQLKIAGYVAEVSSELHNVGAEESVISLSYHSEKLAMAFGVLATPPGTTIRVAKNLRTCVDCHNFAKFLSRVYNREVIIRDRLRFHHFRDGRCSCNDYW
uniref:DYW domain-containing protein n=1 Tax=Kalanchoe fedtschenkoi TaxID=63787 RepID=A0A7N0ZZE8_KALFE